MDRAIKAWLCQNEIERSCSLKQLTPSYTIYGCMLLLSPRAFETPGWQEVRQRRILDFGLLYELISKQMKVTHIAVNQPIPLHGNDSISKNTLRAPSNFTPLYGDFGPTSCHLIPTQADFDAAFWVTAKQNGIYQTWAPRWTMFSRGNISEKARLLTLRSVEDAVEQGRIDGRGSSAIDLYAGIGYFAFSYLSAGVSKVLCWDINTWSIKGLERGAAANKWLAVDSSNGDIASEHAENSETRLMVFNESNEHALKRIERMRQQLPPVRHVNCGLLPTSRGSWQTALAVLDPRMGGWMHVHENFAIGEIDRKAEGVREEVDRLFKSDRESHKVKLGHINRLKSYAPGVIHCVLDIYIPPSTPI